MTSNYKRKYNTIKINTETLNNNLKNLLVTYAQTWANETKAWFTPSNQ